MGQYYILVNTDKREYVDPALLGCGRKLWTLAANNAGAALVVLCAPWQRTRRRGPDERP